MSPESRKELPLRTAIGALLVLLVAFAPLAIGTVHGWTRAVVFHLSAAALLLTVLERLKAGKRVAVTVPLIALALGVLFCLLQLVPIPAVALARISPAAHEVFSTTLGNYSMHAVSLDPSATLAELAKLSAYLAFYAAACTYASRSHRQRQLLLAVVATATLVAALGLLQAALHAKILFFYTPRAEWGSLVRGTFVNPNHFGALMVLAAPVAVALAIRDASVRRFMIPAVLILNVAAVLSLSRSTIIALVVGQGMVLVLDRVQLLRGSARIGGRRGARATLVILIVAAIAVGVSLGAARLRPEIARTTNELTNPHSKVHAWRRASMLVWRYPWTGVGRGAFEQGFTQVDDRGGQVRFPWIENAYLQATADWGFPAAALLFLLAALGLVLAFRRLDEDPLAMAALSGVAALAVHEAADFAVELPGVALPALAVLATLFGRRSSEGEPGRRRFAARRWFLLVPVAVSVAAVAATRFPSAEVDARTLAHVVRDPATSTAAVLAQGRAMCERHPADYLLHALVAERLARQHDPSAMVWLNRAIFLNPTHPAPHMMAGEMLVATRRKAQALLEFRTAAQAARNPREVWNLVVRHYPAIEDLLAATPETTQHTMLLAKWLRSLGRPADADLAYQATIRVNPRYVDAHRRMVEYAIATGDAPRAQARLKALLLLDHGVAVLRLSIEERLLAGDLPGAEWGLTQLGRANEDFDLHLRVVAAYAAAGKVDIALGKLEHLEKTWSMDRDLLIRFYEVRAEIERKAGNEHQSQWNLEQAARLRSP